MQKTIRAPISCYGIGVHSGSKTQVTLKPAPADSGIVFVRTDVTSLDNSIIANYTNVVSTDLSTTISNKAKIKVSTIEHLMAAIWGCGIDNLLIEIDGEEVPIMDGSSKPFVFMIECAGIKYLPHPKKFLHILKDITVMDKDSVIHLQPSSEMIIDLTIDFNSLAIGTQNYIYTDKECFKSNISGSRTFGFIHELEYLKSKGLAKGASLENAIGIDQDIILNHEGLRYKDEFVRHKMLDLIGDIFTIGGGLAAKINGYKTSHYLNNLLLHKIFQDPTSYKWVKGR